MHPDLALALTACGRILVKLKLASDVSAAHVENVDYAHSQRERLTRTAAPAQPLLNRRTQPESKLPAGVNAHADMTGPEKAPSKEVSLHAHYHWRIERIARKAREATGNELQRLTSELLALAAMATRDHMELYHPGQVKRDETEKKAVERLLSEWVGCSSSETAAWFRTTVQSDRESRRWVRRNRIVNGHDPDTGHRLHPSSDLAKAVAMFNNGASTGVIASELGTNKTHVSHMLNGVER